MQVRVLLSLSSGEPALAHMARIHAKPSTVSTVLLTGASGFVGRCAARALLTEGHSIRAVVRSADRVQDLPAGVDPYVADLTGGLGPDAFKGVDAVIHLAARVHMMGAQPQEACELYHETNVTATAKLVAAASSAAVRRFVFVSSVKVHGEGGDQPVHATDPIAPMDMYGRSKADAEAVVRASSGAMEWTIVRPCFVYGSEGRGNFPRLLSLSRLASRVPLPLASIRNRRSMIYVENLVSFLIACIDHPAAARRAFVVADPEALSTPELIRRVGEACGRRARLVPFPVPLLRILATVAGRRGEVERLTQSYVVDAVEAQTILDWCPPFALEEGLARSVANARRDS